jgi:hypothetical protein
MHPVQVLRGRSDPDGKLLGPLPAVRDGDALAYEFELPEQFVPWPGRTRIERVYVLLDLGIGLSQPVWREVALGDGNTGLGIDAGLDDPQTWYVDLVTVRRRDADRGECYVVRDLYLDVIVPVDGRHHRLLDLDEYADAIAEGSLDLEDALDGLRRWQAFLDRHLHADRDPAGAWTDFPPKAIEALRHLPSPLGPPVRWRALRPRTTDLADL